MNIKHLQIAPCWACNLRCPTCNSWKRDQNISLSKGQIKAIVRCPEFYGVKYAVVEGGECFMYHRINYLVQEFASVFPKTSIITNGYDYKTISAHLREWSSLKKKIRFVLSVNGVGQSHDKTRGVKGSFDRAMDTARELRYYGFDFNFQFLPTKWNFGQFERVEEIAHQYGAGINVCYPSFIGKYQMKTDEEVMWEFERIKKKQCKLSPIRSRWEFDMFVESAKEKKLMPCHAGKSMAFIDPSGIIRPCVSGESLEVGLVTNERVAFFSEYDDIIRDIPAKCQYETGQACNATNIGYTLHRNRRFVYAWKMKKFLRGLK